MQQTRRNQLEPPLDNREKTITDGVFSKKHSNTRKRVVEYEVRLFVGYRRSHFSIFQEFPHFRVIKSVFTFPPGFIAIFQTFLLEINHLKVVIRVVV